MEVSDVEGLAKLLFCLRPQLRQLNFPDLVARGLFSSGLVTAAHAFISDTIITNKHSQRVKDLAQFNLFSDTVGKDGSPVKNSI